MKYLSVLFLLFLVTSVNAQTLTTTVETTSISTDGDLNDASFLQLVSAIKSFNGKEIRLEGQLYSNEILEDEFTVVTANETRFEISLDDGRSVSKKARSCPSVFTSFDGKKGCPVAITIELSLGESYDSYFSLGGVGFDVEFK